MMIPLLIRGLRERATAVKRKSALIIDNMAKVRARDHALFQTGLQEAAKYHTESKQALV